MHKDLQIFEQSQINKMNQFREGKTFDEFNSGDTVKVTYKNLEGPAAEIRLQVMTGVVLRKRNNASSSTFMIKKIVDKEYSYTKSFMFYSPMIESIEVIKKGRVRRAKIYYLKELYGKSARIKEKKNKRTV